MRTYLIDLSSTSHDEKRVKRARALRERYCSISGPKVYTSVRQMDTVWSQISTVFYIDRTEHSLYDYIQYRHELSYNADRATQLLCHQGAYANTQSPIRAIFCIVTIGALTYSLNWISRASSSPIHITGYVAHFYNCRNTRIVIA